MDKTTNNISSKKVVKSFVAKVVLWFLGRGIEAAAKLDTSVKNEVSTWDDTTSIMMKIQDYGPFMALKKNNGKLSFVGTKEIDNPNLTIYFKNIESAMLVLTAQLGVAQAFAEHRISAKGDIAFAMSFVRVVYIVEAYLFPTFMAKKVLKRIPEKHTSRAEMYIGTIFGVH